jgi:cob(I)alamin adenosyltransferase
MKIDKVRQISTKMGDKGTSRDYSNQTFDKDDLVFELLGGIDELSSFLGLTYHHSTESVMIKKIQTYLQGMNSLIATSDKERRSKLVEITQNDLTYIENLEEMFLSKTEIKPVFVLPGSDTSLEGAYFDYARSLTRRVERLMVRFIKSKKRDDLEVSLQFLNRLSDLFFIVAREKS